MEQVPNIVRERLKVPTVVLNHPDADVLTAFSERSLPDLERSIVLEHLARCGECREVLALSLPAEEAVQPVLQPSSPPWFAWPALRWGFVAAGIVLVGSVGVSQYRKQTHSSTMAYRAPSPAASQDESTMKAIPAVPAAEPAIQADRESRTDALKPINPESADKTRSPLKDETALNALAPGFTANRPATHPVLSHGPRMANQQINANLQQQNAGPSESGQQLAVPIASPKQQPGSDLIAKVAIPPSSQAVEVLSAAPAVNSQAEDVQSIAVQSQSLHEQQLHGGSAESKVDNTTAPVVGYNAGAKVPGRSSGMATAGLSFPNARWSITSSGALQRSLDQGNSWQDVNVADNSAAAPASMMLTANARAKKIDEKDAQNEKIERSKALPVVFRAVSANGADVWAGGSAGTLYHSTDAGVHWNRVVPSTGVSTLTGEIVSVTFTDPQHGRISTSTSEVWITINAGLTWQKQ